MEVDRLEGSCMLIRREVFEKIGLLDEDYFLTGKNGKHLFLDADVFLLSRDCLERAIYRFREHKADVLLARLRFPNTVLGKYLSMAFPNRLATDWGKYTPHNGVYACE